MAGRVHVVGSVNVDVAFRVERLPGPGMTVLAADPARSGGGKGANVAVAAARDGARVRLVAAVGGDDAGRRSVTELSRDGIELDGVAVLDDRPTGLAMICVDAAAENLIVVAPGANGGLGSAHVEAALDGIAAGDVCVVSFEIPEAAAAAAIRSAAAGGAHVVVNPSPVRTLPPDLRRAAPTIVANAAELHGLTEARDIAAGARALQREGCGAVVVTLGGDGAMVFTAGGGEAAIDAFPADAVDTTGAGDTFTGVLAAGLARGDAIVPAARRAAAAAALSTRRLGARAAMPRRADTDRLLRGDSSDARRG